MALPLTRMTYSKDQARVTISCDPELPLEDRIILLSTAFARQVCDGSLLCVEKWDLSHGRIEFLITPKDDHEKHRRRAT